MRAATLILLLVLALPGLAQQPAGSDWTKVQAIPAGTLIRVAAHRAPLTCLFTTADTDSLTCTRTTTLFFFPITRRLVFPKPEVASIKLSRQFLSALSGAGIGAGAGAGIGAGIESQYSSHEDGHLATVLFALLGGLAGGTVGSVTDFLAAPTVYRAP